MCLCSILVWTYEQLNWSPIGNIELDSNYDYGVSDDENRCRNQQITFLNNVAYLISALEQSNVKNGLIIVILLDFIDVESEDSEKYLNRIPLDVSRKAGINKILN